MRVHYRHNINKPTWLDGIEDEIRKYMDQIPANLSIEFAPTLGRFTDPVNGIVNCCQKSFLQPGFPPLVIGRRFVVLG
jgi:hypothetical protein